MISPASDAPQRRGIIAPEIAEKYGRSLLTVQKNWMTSDEWPPMIGKRGRWNEYDRAEADRVVREHFLVAREAPEQVGSPDDRLTGHEMAEYLGIKYKTLTGYVSRGQFPRADMDGLWARSVGDEWAASRTR